MTRQWISCCVLCALLSARGGAQGLDLDSLYVSRPSTQELEAILDSFNVTLVNGTEPHEQWSLHDPYLFRPDSTAPSVYPLVNCLRVLREQRWTQPIPFAGGDLYNYMLDHFRNGGIELWLDAGFSTGGSETISLKAVTAYWDGRSSADPFTPIIPFSVYPFIHRTQLIIHETRHCDTGAPLHVGGSYDQSLAQEGAYGRACIYTMWTWKHGLGISQRIRTAAGLEAKDFLTNRFVDQPATHPNPDIQAIIDELQATTISAVKADAGNDTTISIPSSAAGIPFTLNGSRSYSVYAPVVEYHWLCTSPHISIVSTRPDTTLFHTPGVYLWTLYVKSAWDAYSGLDTMLLTVTQTATHAGEEVQHPQQHRLCGNFPNPFNPSTTIVFELASTERVRIALYDVLGREVAVVLDEHRNAGRHTIEFDGEGLTSGTYLCRMAAGQYRATWRMGLMR